MPNFRRGTAAIEEAQAAAKSGGNFRPFAPDIRWSEDKEEKYVLFLNPVEDIPLVDIHEFIPVGKGENRKGEEYTKYESFIARTDAAIGEDEDKLADLGSEPRSKNIAVAVELEPIMGPGRGNRPRPKGFEVKTITFERKTDEGTEEVTAPVVGLVTQSPINFFGFLSSFNESEGPVEEVAFKVIRRGTDTNTQYDFTPYLDQDVDLSNLVEYVDGISYLGDQLDEVTEQIADLETEEAAAVIGSLLLETRLQELADEERYEELIGPIDELELRFGNKKKKSKESRPERKSQRSRATKDEEPEDTDDGEDEPEEKPKAKREKFDAIKKKAAAKSKSKAAA